MKSEKPGSKLNLSHSRFTPFGLPILDFLKKNSRHSLEKIVPICNMRK